MNSIVSGNEKKIRSIVLTKEQEEEAYFEGQKKVFFHERNKHYWITEDCDMKTVKDYENLPDNTRL